MRSFLLRTLIALLPILAMGAFNFFRDRAHIVRSESFIAGVRDSMQNGRQVAGLEDYNERALARQIAQRYPSQPDILILGSSRSAELNAWMCAGKDALNLSVSGAAWQDHLGLFTVAARSGKLDQVKKLYLCADPWLLNPNNGEVRWQTLNDEVAEAAQKGQLKGFRTPHSERQWMAKLREMFNPLYAWENLTQQPIPYFSTPDTISSYKLVFANGTIRQQKEKDTRSVEETQERAREFAGRKDLFHLSKFTAIDSSGLQAIEWIGKEMQLRGAEVHLLLMPFHPLVYTRMQTDRRYAHVALAETSFRKMAAANGWRIFGSYNPETAAMHEKDFFDGMHLKRSVLTRLLQP
jgi:hypothetical protein